MDIHRRERTVDAYRVLGVDASASREAITGSYRRLAKLYHPDGTNPNSVRMAELSEAYNEVKTPELRAAYDVRRRIEAGLPGGSPAAKTGHCPLRGASGQRMDFGQYAGLTIAEIGGIDPFYLRWLRRHSSGIRFRDEIDEVLGAARLGRRQELFTASGFRG